MELGSTPGPLPSKSGRRASDKGFLALNAAVYLLLLDWTGRQLAPNQETGEMKRVIPAGLSPIFTRLGMTAESWLKLTGNFGRLFQRVAGSVESLPTTTPSGVSHHFRAKHANLLGPPTSTAT